MPDSLGRRILDAVFPKGSAWAAKIGGDFDSMLDGLGDNIDLVSSYLSGLAKIRNPENTSLLGDLEREHGVVGDAALTDSDRRDYLTGVKFATPGTGSESTLQSKLQAAGFNLQVIQNSPTIDPSDLLAASFLMVAAGGTAYAGFGPNAPNPPFTSIAGKGGGELLVNGEITDQSTNYTMVAGYHLAGGGPPYTSVAGYHTAGGGPPYKSVAGYFENSAVNKIPYVYKIPTDDHRWNFIFFIAESFSGFDTFADWNMEWRNLSAWTSGGGATLSKARNPRHDDNGFQSLQVETSQSESLEQGEPVQPDASLVNAWIPGSGGTLESIAWKNFLVDGDMEKTGVADWTAFSSAIVTKETSDPVTGDQFIRLCFGGVNDYGVLQGISTTGKKYRVSGYGRSGGVDIPQIQDNSPLNIIWQGTNSTQWQPFDFTYTATGPNFILLALGSTDCVDFDNVSVVELSLATDLDMEESTTSSWTAGNSATLTKETTDPKKGSRNLKIDYNGVSSPYAEQAAVFAPGNRHRITGYYRTNLTSPASLNLGGTVENLRSVESWTKFDRIVTVGASSYLRLISAASSPGSFAEFDGIVISPALEANATNNGGIGEITEYGKSYNLNGTTDYYDLGTDARYNRDRRLTVHMVARIDSIGSGDQYLFSRRNTFTDSYNLYMNGSGELRMYYGPGLSIPLNHTVESGKSYDFILTIDTNGNLAELWLNGESGGAIIHGGLGLASGENFLVGAKSGPANFADITVSAFEYYTEKKSPSQIQSMYNITRSAMLSGAYAEQLIPEITESRPLTGSAWGEDSFGSVGVPMILYLDPSTNQWEFAWIGTDSSSEQIFSEVLTTGVSGIRLYTKLGYYDSFKGKSHFDNVTIVNPTVVRGSVPLQQKDKFEKIVLGCKPLRSWAGLLVDYT